MFRFQLDIRKKLLSSSTEITVDFSFKQYFAQAISNSSPKVSEENRKLYNKFLKEVLELLGGEVSSEELHFEAKYVFENFSSKTMTDEKKRELFAAQFGVGNLKKNFENLSKMIETLVEWRDQFVQSDQQNSETKQMSESEIEETIMANPRTEFGADVVFTFSTELLETDFSAQIDKEIALLQTQQQKQEKPQHKQDNFNTKQSAPISRQQDNVESSFWREAVANVPFDEHWLLNHCELYCSISGENFDFTPTELSGLIFTKLRSKKSSNEIATELFEMLGPNSMDFIHTLIQKRSKILELTLKTISANPQQQTAGVTSQGGGFKPPPQIKIRTEEEIQLEKQLRKEKKRKGKGMSSELQQQQL